MPANQLYSQAVEAIKNGQKKQARRFLHELVVKEPGNEAAWLLLSEVVENRNELVDCLVQVVTINHQNQTALEKLKQISPRSIPNFNLVTVREINAAMSSNPGLQIESIQVPDDIDIKWIDKHQASSSEIKPDISNLRQLVKLDPNNEEAWIQLSKQVSDPAEAADCLRHALTINPYNTVAKMRLAQLTK